MADRFYITTPIYYPNAEPHLGHVYTTVAADAVARYHRLLGQETFFLTGTDEHGVKMVKTAVAAGVEPRELADRVAAVFESLWKEIGITHDDFIRTSSDRHKSSVQEIVRRLLAAGDIYLGSYAGWYDEGQEEFVTETEASKPEVNFKSVVSGRPLVRYSEPSYFFKLSKYVGRVLEYIENHPEFVQPEARRNEVVSKLRAGVEDLSISRATLKWGIPMPQDPGHVLYVWIDALSNYVTALGYGSADEALFQKFWPADVHLIGKEILWFHTVYWPAMLFSLGLPLPKKVFAHGWWTSGGRKMSKTLGNFIDLEKLRSLVRDYSLDALRYYLLRAAPFGSDLDFNDGDFNKSFKELSDVLGNCLNRIVRMVGNYCGGTLAAPSADVSQLDRELIARAEALPAALSAAYEKLDLQQCALLPIELARATNGYIEATEPFKLKKPEQAERRGTVLTLAARSIHQALVGLLPILPEKSAAGLAQLGVSIEGKTLGELFASPVNAGAKLGEGQPLFPRVEVK